MTTNQDTTNRINRAWDSLRSNCKFNEGLDSSFRFLCSNIKNTSNISQNEKLHRRCALPWCPHRKEVSVVSQDKASWI